METKLEPPRAGVLSTRGADFALAAAEDAGGGFEALELVLAGASPGFFGPPALAGTDPAITEEAAGAVAEAAPVDGGGPTGAAAGFAPIDAAEPGPAGGVLVAPTPIADDGVSPGLPADAAAPIATGLPDASLIGTSVALRSMVAVGFFTAGCSGTPLSGVLPFPSLPFDIDRLYSLRTVNILIERLSLLRQRSDKSEYFFEIWLRCNECPQRPE
jgi:hypothetical protein